MKDQTANFQKTAQFLLKAETAAERQSLLKNFHNAEDFSEIAKTVKEICYSFWTSQPTVARASAKVLQAIYNLSPQKEIKAYLDWIGGIAAITRGKLVSAIENLDAAAAIFLEIEREYEAAQTQIAKLYALSLLGKHDEAVACGVKILRVFERFGDETSAGKVEKNLGNILSRHELHSRAEKFYLSAQARFIKLDNLEELAMVENGLAITYSAVNDFRKAETFYSQALSRARRAKMFLTEAEIEASIGNLALFRGRLDRALNFLELSRRKYEDLQMPHQTAIAELEIADVYLELNLAAEALAIYETVADKFQMLKMRGEEARARANFGRVAVLKNYFQTARRQLKKAARLYRSQKNKIGAAAVKTAQANLELEQKNYQKVLQISVEIETLLFDSANLRQKLPARLIKAEALRNLGENESAVTELTKIFADAVKYEHPNAARTTQIALGKIAFFADDFRRAEKHFRRAIRLIETARAPLAAEEFRMAFLADKLAPFEFLTKIYLAENKIEKAFATAEKARSRSLTENLDESLQPTKDRKTSRVLQNKLTDLREELNWFYSRLNRADETEVEALQAKAVLRERQISEIMRQIDSTNSNGTKVKSQAALNESENLELLQKTLGTRKVLIEFISIDGVFSAFVITGSKIEYVKLQSTENEILSLLESLRFQFGALRYGAKNLENFIGELKNRADFYLRKLYEKLFAPLEKFVGNRNLVVVPVGAIHYVPFNALFDGERYLIGKHEIVHAPGATVWRFLASKRQKKSGKVLLIGYADEQIPLVNREIENLRKIFRHAESFTGERANLAAFTENAAHFDILHLACHGQFRPESPLFSSLHLADGRLTVRDISSQKLKAELVTLSACETGLNEIFAGEEILGLARGFLSAGAKSLLLSLWTVSDEATADLMRLIYEQRKNGKSSAQSLQIAQRSFIERGVHPYFWSPFVLIGK